MADSGTGSYPHSLASLSDGEENDGRASGSGAREASRSRGGIKRQRVHFSCTECHRRKQKCNRETPCQHCIARKIPERCKTFQPGEDPNDLSTRVSRLERVMSDNFDRMFSMLCSAEQKTDVKANGVASWRNQAQVAHGGPPRSTAGATATGEGDQAEGSEAGDEVVLLSGDRRPDDGLFCVGNMTARVNSLISDSMDRKTGKMADPLILTDPMQHIESAAQLDAVMFDYGATHSISQVLMASLPPRTVCDALIEHFFEHNNWLRQPLSRNRFMKSYDAFWKSGASLNVNSINVYATFMLTAAIGALTYRGHLQVSDDPRVIHLTAKRLFFAARQSLLISVMLGREDIQQVVAFHLASRYLFLDRRISEAWSCVASAVKTAHSIGLHRDGSMLNLPQEECEARRRIWSIIYFADRILSMNLGRPSAIDDDVVDTHLISDEDDVGEFAEYVKPLPGAKIPDGEPPRFLTHTLMRHKLAKIMGKAIMIYQNVQVPAHYSDVVAIDHDLEALHRTFPDHLRSEFDAKGQLHHVNQAWDSVYEFVPVHRYLQQAELLFARMSLHRPYLIRPAPRQGSKGHQHHHRYNFSRRSCVEAAYQTLMLRKDLSSVITARLQEGQAAPSWVSHLGTFNTISAIVILGIYLLMEPQTENAELLLAPLRTFYDLYLKKRNKGGQFDDVKEREFTILHMFLERIEEARSGKSKRKREHLGDQTEGDAKRAATSYSSGGSTAPAAWSRQAGTGMVGNRTLADGPLTKEEDTAGVLLDLNQNGTRRSSGPQPTYVDYVMASEQRTDDRDAEIAGPDKPSEDGSLPWPYLPMRMPHHTNSAPSGQGASPHRANSSGSANNPTPPLIGGSNGSRSSGAGDDGTGASVHQLFDSWFRYNAFENVDLDMLSGAGMSNRGGGSALPGSNMDGEGADASKLGNTNPIMFSGVPPDMMPGWSANQQDTRPRTPLPPPPAVRSATSGVHWSTVPAPLYGPTGATQGTGKRTGDSIPTAASAAGVPVGVNSSNGMDFSSTAMTGMGIPPGPRSTFTEDTDLNASLEPQQASLTAASYDPTFWQR